jgi:hypothetical protein
LEEDFLEVLLAFGNAVGPGTMLAQELGQLAPVTVRRLGYHVVTVESGITAPGLLSQKSEDRVWILYSDNKLTMSVDEVGDRPFANQLAVVDDRHAIANLLHLGEDVA